MVEELILLLISLVAGFWGFRDIQYYKKVKKEGIPSAAKVVGKESNGRIGGFPVFNLIIQIEKYEEEVKLKPIVFSGYDDERVDVLYLIEEGKLMAIPNEKGFYALCTYLKIGISVISALGLIKMLVA